MMQNSDSNPYELKPGQVVTHYPPMAIMNAGDAMDQLPPVQRYTIQKILSTKDSYGTSYLAQDEKDRKVFIKTPKIAAGLPETEVFSRLGDVNSVFLAALRNSHLIDDLLDRNNEKIAAPILELGHYRPVGNENVHVPYLIHEFFDHPNMTQFFLGNNKKYAKDDEFTGVSDPKEWFAIADAITDVVRRVHNRQIVHGEIVPKNILLKQAGDGVQPILVDFGQSFQLDVLSIQGARVRKSDTYIAPECRRQEVGWYTPADIYSLGGVLYYLATGKQPPDILQDRDGRQPDADWFRAILANADPWKTRVHDAFREHAKELMKTNEGIVKILDKCMRPNPVDRYSSVERLQEALRAVNYELQRRAEVNVDNVVAQCSEFTTKWSKEGAELDRLFVGILNDKLEILNKELVDMSHGHFEIYGEREDIIDTLVKYIGHLANGDIYMTVTVPEYWTEHNLGINGRFLMVNRDLARNGVRINRLFLISEEDLKRGSVSHQILRAHLDAWESMGDWKRVQPTWDLTGSARKGGMYVGYVMLPSNEQVKKVQERLTHVAIWMRAATQEKMAINFIQRPLFDEQALGEGRFDARGSQIVKVRFRRLKTDHDYEQLKKMFIQDPLTDVAPQPISALADRLRIDGTPP